MQRDVVAFLSTPAAYGLTSGPVERIDTHISTVWLAGDRAYKLKRAVRFDYVDFSTVALRRVACDAEMRLNRRTAPMLYLAVRAVTRQADGSLALDGPGDSIDWLIEMKRFDQETLFDRLAERGRLDIATMGPLASAIAHLHAGARIRTDRGGRAGMAGVADGNAREFLEHGAGVLDPALGARLAAQTRTELCRHAARLDARCRAGLVRECHGDLHLRNICLLDGVPTIFDGVEFNDDISCIDVLYDLAFLLMDLGRRGLGAHANAVLNAYLEAEGGTGNLLGLAVLPLFLAMRSTIRAKVEMLRARMAAGSRAEAVRDESRAYFALAREFLAPTAPRLVAVGGLSGTGKSALSRAIAPWLGAFPGAVIVRSDVERKRLFGVAPEERLSARAYAPEVSDQVYAMSRKRAMMAIFGGQAAIVDAVQAKPEEREALAALAAKLGVTFTGLWLEAPAKLMRGRVAARRGDVSDATPSVVDEQLGYDIGAQGFTVIDASRPLDEVAAECLKRVRTA